MMGFILVYLVTFGVGLAGAIYSGMLTQKASFRLVAGGIGGTFAGSWFDDGPTLALVRGSIAGDLGVVGLIFTFSLFGLIAVWLFNLILSREGPIQ